MTIFTIFTKRELKAGDKITIYSPSIPVGADVVFKRPADPLNSIARGVCAGEIKPLQTPSKHGKTANVNRFYKEFEVTEKT